MTHHCPNTPFVVVGTKIDLRNSQDEGLISTEEGREFTKQMGGAQYCECSAKNQEGLKDVFDAAIRTVIHPTQVKSAKNKKGCALL